MLDNTDIKPANESLQVANGLYAEPKTRCGILAYYIHAGQIYWSLVESNRVGPVTFSVPAGIQDIIIGNYIKLEVGKPLPYVGISCLFPYINQRPQNHRLLFKQKPLAMI